MTFACLGWGSLIWCQRTLPVVGNWRSDGPDLPLEFARESRDGRITLVVCTGVAAVTTLWAVLDVPTIDVAREALAAREGVKASNIGHSIGWWNKSGTSGHDEGAAIGEWASRHDLSGVVWTALKPRIGKDRRVPASDEVIKHLSTLQGSQRDIAEEYIRLAPRQIVTSYRTDIENALGWTPTGVI